MNQRFSPAGAVRLVAVLCGNAVVSACYDGPTWRAWGGWAGNRFAAQSSAAQGSLGWSSDPRDNLGPSIGCPILWAPREARNWTDSYVIVGSAQGLNARRPLNNQLIFTFPISEGVSGCPAAPYDLVFASTTNGRVVAVRASTFQSVWEKDLGIGAEFITSPMSDGTFVFVAAKDRLWALDAATGQQAWVKTLSGAVVGSAAPALATPNAPTVVVATVNGHVQSFRVSNGDSVWDRAIAGERLNQGVAVGISQTLYVAGFGGSLHALNPVDGSDRWPAYVSGSSKLIGPAVDFRSNRDWIYVFDDSNTVHALNDSGGLVWKRTLPQSPSTPLIIAPGEVLYTSIGSAGNAAVVALNEDTQVWSVPIVAPARYLAVGPNGHIYATANVSSLYSIN